VRISNFWKKESENCDYRRIESVFETFGKKNRVKSRSRTCL